MTALKALGNLRQLYRSELAREMLLKIPKSIIYDYGYLAANAGDVRTELEIRSNFVCEEAEVSKKENRWKIVRKLGLCYNCLKKQHTREECTNKKCDKCRRWHHPLLHYMPRNMSFINSNNFSKKQNNIFSKVQTLLLKFSK